MYKLNTIFLAALTIIIGISINAYAQKDYPVTVYGVEHSGGAIIAVNAVVNENDVSNSAFALAAVYKDGILTDVKISSSAPCYEKGNVKFEFNTPIEFKDNQEVSIFIWASDANKKLTMNPIAKKYRVTEFADEDTDKTYEYTTQTMYAKRGDNNIYGVAYIPQNAGGKLPVVIYSHGFGGSYSSGSQYVGALAQKGYFVYAFDFCGGSPSSRSDGTTFEMSMFTEQADLEAVISMVRGLDYIDKDNIFLLGTSQGGAVSAITAAHNKDLIQGAILLYPAFVLVDDANKLFKSTDEIPDRYFFMWMDVGRIYFEDVLNYDVYGDIVKYDKDVLLIHGTADSIVPLSYSERAHEVYESSELKIIEDAGHGFYGADAETARKWIFEYLDKNRKG